MSHRSPTVQVIMLPRDTNPQGTIFGGVLLSHLDLAGGAEAKKHAPGRMFVTKAMKEVIFLAPVYVGDIVSFYTRTLRIGRTSITVFVEVEATRNRDPRQVAKVTEAEVTYVAVDDERRPVPVLEGAPPG